jgi:hypothetical protein
MAEHPPSKWLSRLGGLKTWGSPLARWFMSYPLLFFEALALVGITLGIVAKPFGIPDLFWHDLRWSQWWTGVGVGLVLFDLGTVGFLLDSSAERPWLARFAHPPLWRLSPAHSELVRYLACTSGVLLVPIALGFVTVVTDVPAVWPLPLGAATMLGLLAFLTVVLWQRFSPTRPRPLTARATRRLATLPPEIRDLHRFAFWYFAARAAIFVATGLVYGALGVTPTVALCLCVALGLAASTYGIFKFYIPDRSFGYAFGIVLVVALINSIGGHQLADLGYEPRTRVDEFGRVDHSSARPLIVQQAALGQWLSHQRPKPVVVVAAVDGGGIRAAVWTTVVLSELENDIPGFPYRIRIITGASGGMVGASFYVGSLQPPSDPTAHRDLAGVPLDRNCLVDRISKESLTAVARQLVFVDMPIPPFLHRTHDRGYALERAWERDTGVLSQCFIDLEEGERAGWRPSLIVSPVIVEDGRRLLISNLDLDYLTTVRYEPGQGPLQSMQGVEFFRAFADGSRLRLSAAARMSATFPYVTAAAELPTEPARRTVDAGYYDDHGVDLAADWIWWQRDWIRKNTNGVLLLQIPNTRALQKKSSDRAARKRSWWVRGLGALTGPIEAVLNSRDSAMAYRNDEWVRTLEETFNTPEDPGFFRTFIFEPDPGLIPQPRYKVWLGIDPPLDDPNRDQDVSLSWRLTPGEVQRLAKAIGGQENCQRRALLREWWGKRTETMLPAAACTERGTGPCPIEAPAQPRRCGETLSPS